MARRDVGIDLGARCTAGNRCTSAGDAVGDVALIQRGEGGEGARGRQGGFGRLARACWAAGAFGRALGQGTMNNLTLGDDVARTIDEWQRTNRTGAKGAHRYTPEQFGLSAAQIRALTDLQAQHAAFEAGQPVSLADINTALAQLAGWVTLFDDYRAQSAAEAAARAGEPK